MQTRFDETAVQQPLRNGRVQERDAVRLLRRYWGHTAFRPGQWEVISAVTAGRDLIAVLPTGTGKSICFQLPALYRDGTAIVLSPLIALMVDQVARLRRRGIRATYVSSTLARHTQDARWMRALRGTYDLLYVAPEQLNSDAFSQLVLSGRISFVAVDEAHCVVDWGRSFRPAYRAIRNYVPDGVQIAALTATATARTRRGIKSVLRLREPVEIVTGFDRPNIRFSVRLNVNRRVTLNSILGSTKAACILYSMTRRSAVLWSSWLNASKIPASVYHGGLDQSDRERGQAEWLGGHTRVMVATSAFGMGIDKADVRTVVHLGMPGSLSAYYQEAGRAGRDGAPADAILLMRAADAVLQKTMIESTYRRQRADTQRQVRIRARRARASALRELREMNRYALGTRCRRQSMLTHFGEFYRPHCGACDNCASDANAGDAARPSDDVAREMIRTIREGQLTWGRLPLMTSTQQRIVSGLVQGNRIAPPIDLDGPIVIC